MNTSEFRKHAHDLVDWMADYLEQVEKYPVKSQLKPGNVIEQLPAKMPESGEAMEDIMQDFEDIVVPGLTHWQSPNFYAYFQANSSPPSVLAEMLTATLGIQGMKWETSPAATEMEEVMMRWLMHAMAIPDEWTGVIHDTASTITLTALLTARERVTNYRINERGFAGERAMRVYCSKETHSSIEKGAKIAGIGSQNVVKVAVDEMLAMRADKLRESISEDLANGYIPMCIVVAIGTTGTMAVDPLSEIAAIAKEFDIWLHVDAAYAGSALVLPEYQYLNEGIADADSFVFNPHKWLFTNFDCSVYFVKDKAALINTFAILPEYLRTKVDDEVNNYCDWGIPLGRRFRSLKLWFVLRSYGLHAIQKMLREHIAMAEWLETAIQDSDKFEMVIPRMLSLVCFRYINVAATNQDDINKFNEQLMHNINADGQIYLTHTVVNGQFTLRMSIGNTNVTEEHIRQAWNTINLQADRLAQQF